MLHTSSRISLLIPAAFTALCAQEMRFVSPLPPGSAVAIEAGVTYSEPGNEKLTLDLYRPAKRSGPLPVVLFVNGVGSKELKRAPQYTAWGRVVTTMGMAGVTYDSRDRQGLDDLDSLINFLQTRATEWGLDMDRLALWSCSANVGVGMPASMKDKRVKASVVYYGIGPAPELRLDLPVLLVRAGLDGAGLNKQIDAFATRAVAANVPLTLINLPGLHHGFDVRDDVELSRKTIGDTLTFLRDILTPAIQTSITSTISEARASSAVLREDWTQASAAYEELTTTKPNDSELHRNYGEVLLGQGQYQRALAEYQKAWDLGNPNRGWISFAAAKACMKLGDREGALKWIENLRNIRPMRIQLNSDPVFTPLRDDSRFRAIADAT